jgi:hypothetical protein
VCLNKYNDLFFAKIFFVSIYMTDMTDENKAILKFEHSPTSRKYFIECGPTTTVRDIKLKLGELMDTNANYIKIYNSESQQDAEARENSRGALPDDLVVLRDEYAGFIGLHRCSIGGLFVVQEPTPEMETGAGAGSASLSGGGKKRHSGSKVRKTHKTKRSTKRKSSTKRKNTKSKNGTKEKRAKMKRHP